jgi:hypothetical protein
MSSKKIKFHATSKSHQPPVFLFLTAYQDIFWYILKNDLFMLVWAFLGISEKWLATQIKHLYVSYIQENALFFTV